MRATAIDFSYRQAVGGGVRSWTIWFVCTYRQENLLIFFLILHFTVPTQRKNENAGVFVYCAHTKEKWNLWSAKFKAKSSPKPSQVQSQAKSKAKPKLSPKLSPKPNQVQNQSQAKSKPSSKPSQIIFAKFWKSDLKNRTPIFSRLYILSFG